MVLSQTARETPASVEKISTGRYEQQLTPPVFVPFNATPTVALYDLTFANTMANIDPAYNNDTLVLGFGTNFMFKTTTPPEDALLEVHLDHPGSGHDDGTYTDVATITDGSGSGATLDITVVDGEVASVTVNQRGSGYALDDQLLPDFDTIGGDLSTELSILVEDAGEDPDAAAVTSTFINTPYDRTGDVEFTTEAEVNNEITIKIPKGNYTLSDLEVAIAKELFKTKKFTSANTNTAMLDASRNGGAGNDYWTMMDEYAKDLVMSAGQITKGVADP
eukprot:COSAG01_NODE_9835_length_2327_cov_9.378815_1_plen_276_part_10